MNPKGQSSEGPPRRERPFASAKPAFKALEESIRFASEAQGTPHRSLREG